MSAVQSSPQGAADTGPGHDEGDFQEYLRATLLRTVGGIAGRTVVFVLLFFWAAWSELGAAALKGAIAADVVGWLVMSFLTWPFHRLQLTAGIVFEAILVFLYLRRESLFHISDDIEATALSALVFFVFLTGRAAAHMVSQALSDGPGGASR